MNFGELKRNIKNLGFEEDDIIAEYNSVIIDASNRAINIINKTITEPYLAYFKAVDNEYELPKSFQLNVNTTDDVEIKVPEKIVELVPLLASHYVWLDDDIVKATLYWNEYDDLKNALLEDIRKPRKVSFFGGVVF